MDQITRRRQAVAAGWELRDEVILIGAGSEILIPGRADQAYPFKVHSEYYYLTDRDKPEGVLAYDPVTGWTDFNKRLLPHEAMWVGEEEPVGEDLNGLAAWLEARKHKRVILLGVPVAGITTDERRVTECREVLSAVRRPKDELELSRMRRAVEATVHGFAAVQPLLVPGRSERDVQIEIEAAFYRNGGDRTAYDTIVGGGPNAALFHFSPSHRAFGAGEFVLIDAGAECSNYAADVTRTYTTSTMSPEQRDVYEIVLRTQERAVARCVVGAEYREIHMGASRDIAEGLVQMGILKGNVDDLVERSAHALFFPHGVGHLVGLGVRDAGGYLPGRVRSTKPGLRYLRIDLPLQSGFTVTIEPGIYFIPVLLRQREAREQYRDDVDWGLVDRLIGIGGVRIEDDIHVTPAGPENLTGMIPKLRP